MDEVGIGAGPPQARWRSWLPLAALAAAIAVFFALGWERHLTFDALAANRAALEGWVDRLGPAAIPVYVLVYGAITSLSVPGAVVLTLSGGLLFGTLAGGFAALAGATIGATVVFLIARTSLGRALERRAGPRLRRIEAGFRENEASYLLVLRLVPLFPFWLVNLVPALLGMRLRTFVLWSVLGMAPGTFIYASLGAGLGAVIAAGRTPELDIIFTPRVLLPLLGLAALALLPVLLKVLRRPR
jgi:uncharacterized membrane protein YdjX (TVP38/TMEM64 family)